MLSFAGVKSSFKCSRIDLIVVALAARTHLSTSGWAEHFNSSANASHEGGTVGGCVVDRGLPTS